MDKLYQKVRLPLKDIKETSFLTIALFYAFYCLYVSFINLVVYRTDILTPVPALTGGLVNETLTVNLISMIIFIFIIILKLGKLNLFDIGIKKNKLMSSLIVLIIIWGSIQLINAAAMYIIWGKAMYFNGWSGYGKREIIGGFLAQVIGNCPFEEMAFRGFLMVQVCLKLKNKKSGLIVGILISQFGFSLMHIPNRILNGIASVEMIASLLITFILGILFAVVYLATDNLFLSMVIHTLWNTPTLIFDGLPSTLLVCIASVILIITWNRTSTKGLSEPTAHF